MKKQLEATTASEMIKEIYMQAARNAELEALKVHMFELSKEQYDELTNTALTLFCSYNGIAGIAITVKDN